MNRTLKASILSLLCFLTLSAHAESSKLQEDVFYLYGQQFTVYRPLQVSEKPQALVVLLHGCLINAQDMVEITGIKEFAEKNNFVVLAPDQTRVLNPYNCWNWFLPDNRTTTAWSSELKNLKAAIDWTHARYSTDPQNTYLAGFSAGSGMAANLFYCYPESFAGVALHSGVAFAAAEGAHDAERVLIEGSRKKNRQLSRAAYQCASTGLKNLKKRTMIVFHGEKDARVDVKNAEQTVSQYLGYADLLDDGKWNHSAEVKATTKKSYNKLFPAKETHYSVGEVADLYSVRVSNLGHLWSGGEPHKYSEPQAVSATTYLINKFKLKSK